MLAGLDAELADNAELLGVSLEWSAAERALRELVADTVHRRADLLTMYRAADDAALRVKLSAELRLSETSLGRLLKQVSTKLAAPPSRKSQKAAAAAKARWDRTNA